MEETFSNEYKPQAVDVSDYFKRRLQATGTEKGIKLSSDSLGNTVYTSLSNTEDTLDGPTAARLVVSDKGKKLIVHNHGLLQMIANPPDDLLEIGEGSEGRVYKVALNTERETKDFVLKYTYPTEGRETTDYTPGVDQMRVMQLLERDDPIPGLHYATPLVASLDMTLAPFVPSPLPAEQLFSLEFAYGFEPQTIEKSIDNLFRNKQLNKRHQDMLKEIFIDSRDNAGKFLSKFLPVYKSSPKGLADWLETHIPESDLSLVTQAQNASFGESEFAPNIVGSVDAIYSLFTEYQQNPDIANESNTESFQRKVRNCHWLVEAMKGQKKR